MLELSLEDEWVKSMLNSLMLSAQASGMFSVVNGSHDNNMAARSLVDSLGCGDLLVDLSAMSNVGEDGLESFHFATQQGWLGLHCEFVKPKEVAEFFNFFNVKDCEIIFAVWIGEVI